MSARERRKQRRKDARLKQAAATAKASAPVVEDVEELEVEELTDEQLADMEEDVETDEPEEKDYMEVGMFGGPTSFEEMDAEIAARQQVEAVNEVLYQSRDITRNILFSSGLEPHQKAGALRRMADGFQSRINVALYSSRKEKAFDFERAELEMLLRQNDLPLVDRIDELIENATAKSALPDTAFAFVKDGQRHYPINNLTNLHASVERILANITKTGAVGETARLAMPYVKEAAQRLAIPSKTNKNSVVVRKDKDGNFRWFGWVSNNFKDRQQEIISEAAHKEYVGWLDEHPQFAPTFRIWHTKGTDREAQSDWWAYENGFLMMSGKLNQKEAESLLKMASKHKLGMSHGFFALSRDEKDHNVITKYRTFEVSDLPVEKAANPWTLVESMTEEKEMDKSKADYISAQLGDAFLEAVKADSALKQEELRAEGVAEKADEPAAPAAETVTAPADTTVANTVVVAAKDIDMAALVEGVAKQIGAKELSAWVTEAQKALASVPALTKELGEVKTQLAELKKSDDEKIAEAITPPAVKSEYAWLNRPSNSKENALDEKDAEDEKLSDGATKAAGERWFAEVTGQPALN